MENHRFYLSTIAADAAGTARQYALGLEIAEYCTACNMDEHFPKRTRRCAKSSRGSRA